jgi:Zn-dependent protease with chaperone function
MSSGVAQTPYERLRQRWVDRAAQRTFDRLVADPESFATAPSTMGATIVATAVLVTAVLFVAGLVWATLHASGIQWVLVALGWLAVIALRPRSSALPTGTVPLDQREFPALHGLVRQVATAVGATPPRALAVDVELNAYVTTIGFVARPAMVLGLPLMTVLSWPGRLALIGHELGHLRGRDTARGRLIDAASNVVGGIRAFLAPERRHRDDLYSGRFLTGGAVAMLTQVLQILLLAPFLLLGLALDRLALAGRPHREYLADRRSAEVVGTEALVEFLATDLEGLRTSTAAAARRGEDPYEFLARRLPMSAEQLQGRLRQLALDPHRADATHPRDDLRIRLLEAHPRARGELVADIDDAALDDELARLRHATTKAFRQDLLHGPYG